MVTARTRARRQIRLYRPTPPFRSDLADYITALFGSDFTAFPALASSLLDYSRSTTATVIDYAGVPHLAQPGEARIEGARRVENLAGSYASIAASQSELDANVINNITAAFYNFVDGVYHYPVSATCIRSFGRNDSDGYYSFAIYVPPANKWSDPDAAFNWTHAGTVAERIAFTPATVNGGAGGWLVLSRSAFIKTTYAEGRLQQNHTGPVSCTEGMKIMIWRRAGVDAEPMPEYVQRGTKLVADEVVYEQDFSSLSEGDDPAVELSEFVGYGSPTSREIDSSGRLSYVTDGGNEGALLRLTTLDTSEYAMAFDYTTDGVDPTLHVAGTHSERFGEGRGILRFNGAGVGSNTDLYFQGPGNVAGAITIDNIKIVKLVEGPSDDYGWGVPGVRYFFDDPDGNPLGKSDAELIAGQVQPLTGLMLENAATNLFPISEPQAADTGSSGMTITGAADSVEEFPGILTSKVMEFADGTNSLISALIALDAGNYTLSAFVKREDGSALTLDGDAGTSDLRFAINAADFPGPYVVEPLADNVYRISATINIGSTASHNIQMQKKSWYASGDVHVSGIQFEAGLRATSYVATSGTAVTRVRDAIAPVALGDWYTPDKGAWLFDVEFTHDSGWNSGFDSSFLYAYELADSGGERYHVHASSTAGVDGVYSRIGNVGAGSINGGTHSAGDREVHGLRYDANLIEYAKNGVLVGSDVGGVSPDIDTAHLFPIVQQRVKSFAFAPEVSDEQLLTLTDPDNSKRDSVVARYVRSQLLSIVADQTITLSKEQYPNRPFGFVSVDGLRPESFSTNTTGFGITDDGLLYVTDFSLLSVTAYPNYSVSVTATAYGTTAGGTVTVTLPAGALSVDGFLIAGPDGRAIYTGA